MKIALIGLPQTGKKTVFSLLTGIGYDQFAGRAADFHIGNVKIADPRVDRLSAMYNPKKTKHAEIEVTLAPAPPHEPKQREQWLNKLKNMDALCHIVRAFEDAAVFHAKGSVDALRDINEINFELTISDLSLVETRLSRIAQDQKKKFEQERADEEGLLRRLIPHLEAGKPLREFPWHEGEEKRVRSLQFLTLKPLVMGFNCSETNFADVDLIKKVDVPACSFSAKLELEVAQIEDPQERAKFLSELGIKEPAIDALTRLLYDALGYISFFTVGEDEVRAWTLRQGETALDAARTIHSDLARGFIRAEVMKFGELVAAADVTGSGHKAEVQLKETGKLLLKGKDYVVEDGDILHVRHSG